MDSSHGEKRKRMNADSSHGEKRKRMNAEGDRLSNLPDDLIHKILSFLEITEAIETSALSSRWRYMWTSMPSLSFSSEKFHSVPEFSKFIGHVLSRRNNHNEVSSVNLTFHEKVNMMIVKKIWNFVFTHHVQQLKIIHIDLMNGKRFRFEFSLPVFVSKFLQDLTLRGRPFDGNLITTPNTWELPALTMLNLHGVILQYENTNKCAGLFSNLANLKKLILSNCSLRGMKDFNICHPGLSSLTLEDVENNVNVVTPQLKNLTIKHVYRKLSKLSISAPNLFSFCYEDSRSPLLELSSDFIHLEKVDICITGFSYTDEDAHTIDSLLQQFHSVKFLTMNLEVIETLSLLLELISHQPSPLTNLKSLKIYPEYVTSEKETQPKITMSTEVKNYLLDGSPGANFTMVSHEEIRAVRDVVSIEKLMKELQVELDQFKEHSKTCMTDTDQVENDGMTPPDTKVKGHFGERVARVKSYLEETNKQWERGLEKSGCILSKLQEIEEVHTKLPASHRAELQAKFSGLSAEAGTVLDNMLDNFKNQCDKALRLEQKLAQTKAKIQKMEQDKETKEDLKTVALGTSKINYLDPRITVAWCKRHEVPIQKIFSKSLLAKFGWSMDVDPSFRL